ncbi:recombinase family protein [Herbidospora sp. NBRC 101105]|uniref:recombinase family protein n=1 Tax=Herbidospora sp. NBRC 101105 TaxID=3032195 RepID=UPI0024A1D8A3|nr:recombinase family protein [Herbidospora sp. NBRC 101105]GLX99097.1 integrase [Herbidospora sp. NBRC 101105]
MTADLVPVASYARISADLRGDEHGVQDQHRINRETAKRHGWTVVHEFTDNDKSAAKADVYRDEFESMIKALRAGRLADGPALRGVVVVANDRLARRPGDYERFVEAFTYNDGFVFADSKQRSDLYSEDVESMGLFGAVISKMEVRKMQRRMRASHQSRALQGRAVGGPRPFGWKDDRITLDESEAALLRQAARDFVTGSSLYSIVMDWQRRGIRTPRGNEWRKTTLRAALSKPRMCGYRILRGEIVCDASGSPVVGDWQAILTPDEWLAVRDIMDSRRGHSVKRGGALGAPLPRDYREHRHLLTGILRCGRVIEGGGMCNAVLRTKKYGKEKRLQYFCPGRDVGGCGGVGRRADLVDFAISELVLQKMESAQFVDADDAPQWSREQELSDLEEQLKELTRQWRAQKISNNLYFVLVPELEADIARLRAEKNSVLGMAERARVNREIDVEDIRRRWYKSEEDGGLPLSRKRAHIREMLHAVIVHPAGRGRTKFNPDLLEPVWVE